MGYKYEIDVWVRPLYQKNYEYQPVWQGNSRIKMWFAVRRFKKNTGGLRLTIR